MHRFVLVFVGVAALLSGWAIAEAQVRTNGWDQLFASDPYLPVIRTTALGLWLIAAMSVATREVRRSMAIRQAQHADRIIEANQQVATSNRELVKIVRECADALLQDAGERKRAEINSMLAEYGLQNEKDQETCVTHNVDPQNLLSFRRQQRSSGDG